MRDYCHEIHILNLPQPGIEEEEGVGHFISILLVMLPKHARRQFCPSVSSVLPGHLLRALNLLSEVISHLLKMKLRKERASLARTSLY